MRPTPHSPLLGLGLWIVLAVLSGAVTAQTVPFKVIITKLVQLDAGVDTPPAGFLGDYYARVAINGITQDNRPACGDGVGGGILVPITLFEGFDSLPECSKTVPWVFTQDVPSNAPVTVRITILDDDSLSGDDEADADPERPDTAVDLVVDPVTGRWSGDGTWPQNCSPQELEVDHLGGERVQVCWQTSFDTDGDGLLDVWERSGIDVDNDGVVDLDLVTLGANPLHKDLFVELDWMPGHEPRRSQVQEWKAAFAAAPIDAGGTPNPDGLPGITLWVDTGGLTDAAGNLVGDNLGGGNQVPLADISGLTEAFYQVKHAHFNPHRILAFRYALSSANPTNNTGISMGNNTATTLHDTTQTWLNDEWENRTVTITTGTGVDQQRTITANSATALTVDPQWDTVPDATSTYRIALTGGQGELGGNDFIDYNHTSSTLMHELGHNLNLGHGGGDSLNCKPNYVSVMNYDVDRIFRLNPPSIIDYSPPRLVAGSRGSTDIPDLDEHQLDEALILDPADPDNLFVFVEQGVCMGGANAGASCAIDADCASGTCAGAKRMRPLNAAVDWNGDGDTLDAGVRANIDTAGTTGFPAACANDVLLPTLKGHDDWSQISLSFVAFGNAADAPINLVREPEPTLEERRQHNEGLNTADLALTKSAPATVEVGNTLTYTLWVTHQGPNPALAAVVVDTLPPQVSALSTTADCLEEPVGTLTCALGSLLPGDAYQLEITVATASQVCRDGVPLALVNTATVANVAEFAGADPAPSDNAAAGTTTPVDTTPPDIKHLAAHPNVLWTPNHKMVPVAVLPTVSDICDAVPDCQVVAVSSNEPQDGLGDGDIAPDWALTGKLTVPLRAERSGTGSGRVYTLTVACTDASGNRVQGSVDVAVPRATPR